MAGCNENSLIDGRGWELAYQAQEANSNKNERTAFLWQEPPIEFLNDTDLQVRLRRENVFRVLDAGCGDGRNSLALASKGFFVVGVDQAPTAIKLAVQRAIEDNYNHVLFAVDDVKNLHQGGPFDLVLCADTLGQLDDPGVAIENFKRALKPGGLLLFNVYTKEDGTYGCGARIDDWTFVYKETLFKYFNEQMVRGLVAGMEDVHIRVATWLDPPHGDFRPEPHVHNSFVILARKPRKEG